MNAMTEVNQVDALDVFTVTLPFQLPDGFQVDSFEYPLIKLQELIIDDLQFKLKQRHEQFDPKLKAMYQALLDERNELIAERDRAKANADTFRALRNKAEEQRDSAVQDMQRYQNENAELNASLNTLKTQLKHANQELAGLPVLVENKVNAALANHVVDNDELHRAYAEVNALKDQLSIAEDKRSKTAEKNSELNASVSSLNLELKESKAFVEMLTKLTTNQLEQIECSSEGVRNAYENYQYVMHNIDEVLAYAAIVAHENEELRNDNLYLSEAVAYHDLKVIWRKGPWQVFMLCKSRAIKPREGDPVPHTEFGLMYALNDMTGHGHSCYLDESGELQIPACVPAEHAIPESDWEEFTESALKAPVKGIETALERAVQRTINIKSVARLLDLDWAVQIGLVDIAQRLSDYVPEQELHRALSHLERAKALAPQSTALIQRINKRFNTDYGLHSKGGRIPDRTPPKKVIGKPKRERKKKSR